MVVVWFLLFWWVAGRPHMFDLFRQLALVHWMWCAVFFSVTTARLRQQQQQVDKYSRGGGIPIVVPIVFFHKACIEHASRLSVCVESVDSLPSDGLATPLLPVAFLLGPLAAPLRLNCGPIAARLRRQAGGQVHIPAVGGDRCPGHAVSQAWPNVQVQGLRPEGV